MMAERNIVQKKICMLGTFAVGKTSLVRRFVESIYTDKYHTTVGVKIDKKALSVAGQDVSLVLWDIAGEDALQKVQMSYLRGASGYILVADGTRIETLATALDLDAQAAEATGGAPRVLVLNKRDLAEEWEIDAEKVEKLRDEGWTLFELSAKSGEGVEEIFLALASRAVGS